MEVAVGGAPGQTQTVQLSADRSDTMEITPLGAGCEVGRSCCVIKYRGSTVMFDCGVHPANQGIASLPFFDAKGFDPSEVDLLLVTHFHMDHCGAVPYFTEKTSFKGRVFMTHPTKAIYKILLHDAVKVGHEDGRLWDEKDMLTSMEKIELINYHQTLDHKGVRFWCYNAGHVLGAAMFMVEIGGVRVLYTGDFSREEDRHLLGAELPTEPPNVLIVESTYGVSLHEPRAVREQRFTTAIHQIVARGGRCLIPVFALGRSQELLLILDEYWKAHPELHGVPIFYASKVAQKSMRVYQTYINMMNDHIRSAHMAGTNPWDFTHVQNLDLGRGGTAGLANFDDSRPMVVMASPGMMQNGFSRDLFEMWCSDRRNGLMMPGYSVAGTLAHHILSEPKEITTSQGDRVPVNLSIHYISFSAHSDYAQTSDFINTLRPNHVVLVHGAKEEMMRLKRELVKHHDPKKTAIHAPGNLQPVSLRFHQEKVTPSLTNPTLTNL
jgi:cleavage and polyadenylation specificity factor subunit 3